MNAEKIRYEFEVIEGPIVVRGRETNFTGCSFIDFTGQIRKSCVSVFQIAKVLWAWRKAAGNCFELIDALIDHISETTVHELIHRDGDVWHKSPYRQRGWTMADFAYLTDKMGHPSAQMILKLAKREYANIRRIRGATKRMTKGLIVIDLDEE